MSLLPRLLLKLVLTHAECKPVANGVANGQIGHDECSRPELEQQPSTSRPHPQTGDGARVSDPGTSTLMSIESTTKQCCLQFHAAANTSAKMLSPGKTNSGRKAI